MYKSDLEFLHSAAVACWQSGSANDGMWIVAPITATICYDTNTMHDMERFEIEINEEIPELGRFGRARSKKAYYSKSDTITKPSYSKRIHAIIPPSRKSQLDMISDIYSVEPNSGGLVFSVFSPIDLYDRKRPGYVPCMLSGTFLMRKHCLDLNVFFRSQSIVEFGIYDLIYLRQLQAEIMKKFSAALPRRRINCGNLNLFFSRIIVQRRLARRKILVNGSYCNTYLDREAAFNSWLSVISKYTSGGASQDLHVVDVESSGEKVSIGKRISDYYSVRSRS